MADRTRRILLAEANPLVRRLATEVLAASGTLVVEAPSGEAALKLMRAERGRFDALVVGRALPVLVGAAMLADEFASLNAGRPVLVADDHGRPAGALPLAHPLDPADLAAALHVAWAASAPLPVVRAA